MKKYSISSLFSFMILSIITSISFVSCRNNNDLVEVEIPKREEFIAAKKSEFDQKKVKTKQGPFEMTALPFTYEDIADVFSPETMALHYEDLHLSYANSLNTALHNTSFVNDSLVAILTKVGQQEDKINYYAGAFYNHNFFWQSLAKSTDTSPNTNLVAMINQSFGSYTNMKAEMIKQAIEYKGVGWLWLVKNRNNQLQLIITNENQNPITLRLGTPLLVIDLWEHAYINTYKGDKENYLKAVLPHLNWDFAASNLNKIF